MSKKFKTTVLVLLALYPVAFFFRSEIGYAFNIQIPMDWIILSFTACVYAFTVYMCLKQKLANSLLWMFTVVYTTSFWATLSVLVMDVGYELSDPLLWIYTILGGIAGVVACFIFAWLLD